MKLMSNIVKTLKFIISTLMVLFQGIFLGFGQYLSYSEEFCFQDFDGTSTSFGDFPSYSSKTFFLLFLSLSFSFLFLSFFLQIFECLSSLLVPLYIGSGHGRTTMCGHLQLAAEAYGYSQLVMKIVLYRDWAMALLPS